MSDLISREAFYKELSKNSVKSNLTEDDFDYICHLLFIQPTIDAEPVRHGHWEPIQVQPYFRKHYHNLDVCCSACHTRGNARKEFCSECGAKMDEVAE